MTFPASNRLRKGSVDRPSAPESIKNCRVVHAGSPRPFAECPRFSHEFEPSAVLPVIHLLQPCRPAAIARLVVAIVVLSVKRMLRRWSLTHVGNEVRERMKPALTYRDAPRTIRFKLRCVRIAAAGFHARPYPILWRVLQAVRPILILLFSPAPARHGVSDAELVLRNDYFIAAGAATLPLPSLAFLRHFFEHNQSAVAFAWKYINASRHHYSINHTSPRGNHSAA